MYAGSVAPSVCICGTKNNQTRAADTMVATRPDPIPPIAALTTTAAVMGSQNAPVETRTSLSASKAIAAGTSAINAPRSTRLRLTVLVGSRQPDSNRFVDPLSSAFFGVVSPTVPRCVGVCIHRKTVAAAAFAASDFRHAVGRPRRAVGHTCDGSAQLTPIIIRAMDGVRGRMKSFPKRLEISRHDEQVGLDRLAQRFNEA